jgi:hypothetical protein
MRFGKSILFLAILLVPSFCWSAQTFLPKLIAKQSLDNIRFISRDGRYTYIQKRTGELSLAFNYKASDLLVKPPGTHYLVTLGPGSRKVIVEEESMPHQHFDLFFSKKIYLAPLGSMAIKEYGMGRYPQLHEDDNWLSFYSPKERNLKLYSLVDESKKHFIKLNAKANPFFQPQAIMIDNEHFLFTDSNEKGFAALLSYHLPTQAITVLRKASTTGTRFDLCRFKNYYALGEFSFDDTSRGSRIWISLGKTKPSIQGLVSAYESNDSDLGQLICDDEKIWFIKTISENRKLNTKLTEAATLDLQTFEVKLQSNLERVVQILAMDGRILIPFRDDVYVVQGPSGLPDDILKKPETDNIKKTK